jgi:hypothetical protein
MEKKFLAPGTAASIVFIIKGLQRPGSALQLL